MAILRFWMVIGLRLLLEFCWICLAVDGKQMMIYQKSSALSEVVKTVPPEDTAFAWSS